MVIHVERRGLALGLALVAAWWSVFSLAASPTVSDEAHLPGTSLSEVWTIVTGSLRPAMYLLAQVLQTQKCMQAPDGCIGPSFGCDRIGRCGMCVIEPERSRCGPSEMGRSCIPQQTLPLQHPWMACPTLAMPVSERGVDARVGHGQRDHLAQQLRCPFHMVFTRPNGDSV